MHDADNEPWTWELSPAEYTATVEKISKINARAAKRGFTGRIEVNGHPSTLTEKNAAGFTITREVYLTTLTGTAPSYNGWSLLASLEWDQNAGLIVRTVPGVENVDRTCLVEGKCDHCEIKRYRKNAYVVVNNATGETKQVGSTCIKDFLGWDASVVFLSAESIKEDVDSFLSGGSYDRDWATLDVLAIAWAAIQVNGWHPANDFGTSTKASVITILDPPRGQAREIAKLYDSYIADSYAQAIIIRDFILSDDFNGSSEYVTNLKAIASAEFVSYRSLGFIVSAPQAWAKAMERDLIRKSETNAIVNEYIGNVGDKIEVQVTIKSIRYIDGAYGTITLYTMVTNDNHLVKWFASRNVLGETADAVFTLKGTIKKHDDYNGVKSTILTRCKIV
jgi:hypothetical protein